MPESPRNNQVDSLRNIVRDPVSHCLFLSLLRPARFGQWPRARSLSRDLLASSRSRQAGRAPSSSLPWNEIYFHCARASCSSAWGTDKRVRIPNPADVLVSFSPHERDLCGGEKTNDRAGWSARGIRCGAGASGCHVPQPVSLAAAAASFGVMTDSPRSRCDVGSANQAPRRGIESSFFFLGAAVRRVQAKRLQERFH